MYKLEVFVPGVTPEDRAHARWKGIEYDEYFGTQSDATPAEQQSQSNNITPTVQALGGAVSHDVMIGYLTDKRPKWRLPFSLC